MAEPGQVRAYCVCTASILTACWASSKVLRGSHAGSMCTWLASDIIKRVQGPAGTCWCTCLWRTAVMTLPTRTIHTCHGSGVYDDNKWVSSACKGVYDGRGGAIVLCHLHLDVSVGW